MNRHPHDNTDVLDHATDALRGAPVPPGPPAEVLATVSALDGRVQPTVQFKTRSFPMKRVLSIAAAILLFLGVAAIAYHLFGGSATVAFAEVRQQIQQAQTMKCRIRMMVTMPGQSQEMVASWYYKEPGLMRQEAVIGKTGEKVITTANFEAGKLLTLVPSKKQAVVVDMGQLPPAIREKQRQMNFTATMKEMVQGDSLELGTKEIDGRRVKGFRATRNAQTMDVWVDPKTAVPVAMEMSMTGIGSMTIDGFVLGEEIDDALFSITPPADYKVMNASMPMGDATEDDLITGLRLLAEVNDNVFPDSLVPAPEIMRKLGIQNKDLEGLSDEEQVKKALQITTPLVRMSIFSQLATDFRYVGGGVTLGDAGRILCRYKPPGKDTYRVIYGDLRAADAPTDPQSP